MRLVEVFLFEAVCLECGSKDTYQGFNSFECPTKGCRNYSQKQDAEINKNNSLDKFIDIKVGDKYTDIPYKTYIAIIRSITGNVIKYDFLRKT
jgi:hypothetical protein